MEFSIYSLGSAVFMEDILNAVAMISGSGTIESLAMIGLLVGAFILGFKAVYSNTGIQFQQLLVCFVLYLAMYGPTATAVVEDIYTGEVAVVDGVPIGPLAVGSIVSNIGYQITQAMEQGFSTPSMTSYGFADPLNTLIHVRQIAHNVISLPSMTGNGGNSNLLASWSNYIKECTLVAASSDDRALQELLNKPEGIEALAFPSNVYYTKIYDGPADGSTKTCTDAFTSLKAMTESAETDLLGDIARGMTTAGSKPDSFAIEARLDDALSSIAAAAIDARQYAVMSAVMPILEGAPSAVALQDMQGAAAIMMNQAMAQQATQWAAEGSMFTRYIRPFMTFFEGFIYAITPIMAFVIVLGGFGISLVSKYLMILIWMNLWMPVLAIINLYALSTTQAKIEAILGGSFSVGTGLSFNQMRDMMPILETQIGIAGMLASAVPALCMFLVYGTSVAASGLATKLGGSDTINEKIASPDVVTPGGGLQMTSQAVNDFNGTRASGSEANLGDMSMSSAMTKAVKSANSKMHAESATMQSQALSAFSTAYSNTKSIGEQASVGRGVQAAFGMSNDAAIQTALQDMENAGFTQTQRDAQIAALTAGWNASGGVKAGNGAAASASAGVSAGGTTTSQQTHDNAQSGGRSTQESALAKLSEAVNNKLAKTNGREIANNVQSGQNLGLSSTDTNSLMRQAARTDQSAQTYEDASAFQQQYGYGENLKLNAFATNLMNQGRGQEVINTAQSVNGKQYDQNYKTLGNMMYDDNQRSVAAAALTLAQTNNFDKIFGDGATDDSGRNADLVGADASGVDASGAGRMVDTRAFDSDYAKQDAALRGDRSAEGLYLDKAPIVKNDADVYRDRVAGVAARDAEARIRGREREVSDDNESYNNWVKGGMNFLGSAIGTRGSASDYEAMGQQIGLTEPQAKLFAAMSTGDISDGRMAWNNYANSVGMDNELRDGMYNTIRNTAFNDEGAAAGVQDIVRMNQVGKGFDLEFQADSQNYEGAAAEVPGSVPTNQSGEGFNPSHQPYSLTGR
ncbi:TPA: conjugal transfer protein TraG N-terminal domain-containing protein [Pseudomonas aeruginosa]|nr:conjugal transfer protein TraG N-terminal domain-containing protein [Pseudomonas aeruginosa]